MDGQLHYYGNQDDTFPIGTVLLRDVQKVTGDPPSTSSL
jgi:hypothetical protein